MIDPVTGWFEVTQYKDKRACPLLTYLKLCGYLDILDQWISHMTKGNHLLVMSSDNT